MVKTASTMLPLGTQAPDFSLPNFDGRTVSLADFRGAKALLVMFISNHCPFVKHVAEQLAALGREYQQKGVAMVAIGANDSETYPDDAQEKIADEVRQRGYTFAYLFDQEQASAKAYHAACTPDFFLFDEDFKLAYRGQLDASRPGSDIPVTGEDLRRALDAVLMGKAVPEPHAPSIGCNIKWRKGSEPDYFNPAGIP